MNYDDFFMILRGERILELNSRNMSHVLLNVYLAVK